jgi:hypothetical protein
MPNTASFQFLMFLQLFYPSCTCIPHDGKLASFRILIAFTSSWMCVAVQAGVLLCSGNLVGCDRHACMHDAESVSGMMLDTHCVETDFLHKFTVFLPLRGGYSRLFFARCNSNDLNDSWTHSEKWKNALVQF